MISVVMLVNEFPPLKVGGGERQAERLAVELARQGVRVGVVTRGRPDLPPQEVRDGFWVQRVLPRGGGKFAAVTFILGAMRVLWARRAEFRIVHAHLAFSPAVAAALIGPPLGKRVVVKFGNSGPFGDVQVSQASIWGRLKLALLRRRADVVIALDDAMRLELEQAGFAAERIVRMDNGVCAADFRPPQPRAFYRRSLGLEGREVIVAVGRLEPQKAYPDLLRAVAQVFQRHVNGLLLIVGDGSQRRGLEAMCAQLGLGEQVRFVGNVNDVRPYLWAADVFALASHAEGMSNALLEAMAAGLPCVVTAVGNAPEMLAAGACGVLVPPGEPDRLAAALTQVLADADSRRRLGEAARRRVQERYDMPRVAEAYQHLYRRLLAGGG